MSLNQKNGGFIAYPDRVQNKTFFRATDRATKKVTVKSGQVLKAYSFLKSDAVGKSIAYNGFLETAEVTFANITASQTIILAGLTYTDGGSGTTAEQLAAAWSSIADGAAGVDPAQGAFTGTLTGYFTQSIDTTRVMFTSTSPDENVTDLADSGTATDPLISIIQGTATRDVVEGVLCFDVDATSSDVDASAFTSASFWQDALVWAVDASVDTIELSDGTTVSCTAYNTGCSGSSEVSHLLKRKFVEGSSFQELGFLTVGEEA